MTARGTWKAFERRTGLRLGGKRIPVTGLDRDGADVLTPMFAIQCKLGRRMPAYLRQWLDGIRRTAGERTGIVVWKPLGARDDQAVVVLSLKDWTELHGKPTDPPVGRPE